MRHNCLYLAPKGHLFGRGQSGTAWLDFQMERRPLDAPRCHSDREHPPHDVNVVIEVPVGGEPIKYEIDKAPGTLVVDRFLYTPMRYPGTMASSRTRSRPTAIRSTCSSATRAPSCPAPSSTAGRSACSSWRMRAAATRRSSPCRAASSRCATTRWRTTPTCRRSRAADRALLRALQGSRARQVGEDRPLGRCRRGPPLIAEAIERAKGLAKSA